MRRALLDTDILSEILKGKNETVRQRAAAYQAQLGDLTICTVTVMEVVKGLHRLGREEAIGRFLSGLGTLPGSSPWTRPSRPSQGASTRISNARAARSVARTRSSRRRYLFTTATSSPATLLTSRRCEASAIRW
jgi:predicted nucleic acid-binding protein